MVGPRLAGPRLAGPRLAGLRLAGPRLAGPRLVGPRLAGPRLAGPRLAGPWLVGPRARRAISLFLLGPFLQGLRLALEPHPLKKWACAGNSSGPHVWPISTAWAAVGMGFRG